MVWEFWVTRQLIGRQEESASDRAQRQKGDTLTRELTNVKDTMRRQEVGVHSCLCCLRSVALACV